MAHESSFFSLDIFLNTKFSMKMQCDKIAKKNQNVHFATHAFYL